MNDRNRSSDRSRSNDRDREQGRNSGAGSRQMEQQTGGGSYRPDDQPHQRSDMSRQPGDDVNFESDREDSDFPQAQSGERRRQPENRQREQDRGGKSRDNNRSGSDSNR